MKNRYKSYNDFGLDVNEAKKLIMECRRNNIELDLMLLQCAVQANPALASDLYYSLREGLSYDVLTKYKTIPISKNDFYGYRRKTLMFFREQLRITGEWE